MAGGGSTVVGIIVAVLIVAAVGSIGYYQFEVAPNITSSSSTTQTSVTCTKATCAYVNITANAGACITASNPCGYSPLTITVVIGKNNTVVWTSLDSAVHTVTGTSWGSTGTCQGVPGLCQGDTYQYTFTTAGTYSYHCVYHAGMIAQVVVKAA
jgi:plastocyanin